MMLVCLVALLVFISVALIFVAETTPQDESAARTATFKMSVFAFGDDLSRMVIGEGSKLFGWVDDEYFYFYTTIGKGVTARFYIPIDPEAFDLK